MGNSDVYIHLRTAETGTKEMRKKARRNPTQENSYYSTQEYRGQWKVELKCFLICLVKEFQLNSLLRGF